MKVLVNILLCVFLTQSAIASNRAISDIESMAMNSEGNYDVVCKDGTTETITPTQLNQNNVCKKNEPAPDIDIEAIFSRPQGDFFALCKNRTWQIASSEMISSGQVCNNNELKICATSDEKHVQFQIRSPQDATVGCFYRRKNTPNIGFSAFGSKSSYNEKTKLWSCPNWGKGNPDYTIKIKVNYTDYITDEPTALSNPCNE